MLEGVSVPSLICMVRGDSSHILDSFVCKFCGASGTRSGCKRMYQGVIGSKIIKNQTSERFGGVLGAFGSMNAEREAR